jgi:hypothetical protein
MAGIFEGAADMTGFSVRGSLLFRNHPEDHPEAHGELERYYDSHLSVWVWKKKRKQIKKLPVGKRPEWDFAIDENRPC